METYHSELFGEMYQPVSFLELIELVTSLSSFKGINVMLWRGQGNIDWPIHSGAYRRILNSVNGDRVNEWNITQYENRLLLQARHKGYDLNNGLPIGDMELLARMQHHGAATRLVDFSKNVLIALWFCVDSNPNQFGSLLGVHTHGIGGGMEGTLNPDEKYRSVIEKLEEYDYPIYLESTEVSKRIAAQHGVFLYSDVSQEVIGSLKLPNEKGGKLLIAISPKLKEEARKLLIQHFDIRNETLFPDLDGFAAFANSTTSNVREMFRW
jgi:hypothetical protein